MTAFKDQCWLPSGKDASVDCPINTRHFQHLPDAVTAHLLLDALSAAETDVGPLNPQRPLILYGAGNFGRLARDHLRAVGQDFMLVLDRNAEALAADPFWAGTRLIKPEKVPADIRQQALLAVSVALAPFAPIQADLMASGWAHVVPFYDIAEAFRDRHPLSNGWFADSFGPSDLRSLKQVSAGWADDVSRAHHLQFIAWRRLRAEWNFEPAPVSTSDRFFIPEISAVLRDDEVFIDAGAYHGGVTAEFIDKCAGRFVSILAIEPDASSRAFLTRWVENLPDDHKARIAVIDAVVDSVARNIVFHGGLGYASQISPLGNEQRRSTTLDGLDLPVTYLKLHLEGNELPALKGAVATISRYRPMIAATVYHNADGLHATAQWLMETLEDYRILFRLHSWCGTGAVIYAIPRERQPPL